ncbi:MAG: hypothetical protein CVT59_01970 [Actinobacteria bacterium HGW-Actinobacteria-1]|jgi:hypothetical protein|nr:MAG: hypothetical protein CVT59_01970 [Actinobacteria bacterium HGW-Actinobacteria-1]
MYNLRYHVASLVAVFLALTVGLLLGTVVAERGTLEDQSSTLVSDLQKQFAQIQKDNADLRSGLERDRSFAEDMVPALTAGVLDGKNVVVLVNTGRSNGLSAAVDAIEIAGGTAVVLTQESAGMGLDETIPEGLPALLGDSFAGQSTAPASEAFKDAVAEAIATELRRAGNRPVLDLLIESDVISSDSTNDIAEVDGCVLMTSFGGQPDDLSAKIAGALGVHGAVVVGAEATSQVTGVAAESVDRGFSALDNVDTPQGAYSLVWLLTGRASGYFGVGPGTDAVYPAVVTGG